MLTTEMINEVLRNEIFINGMIALASCMVVLRFLAFVKAQWREGQFPELLPCSDCGNRLSPAAHFCPSCGRMLKTLATAETPQACVAVPAVNEKNGHTAVARRSRYMPRRQAY